jgi:hypothetical protein
MKTIGLFILLILITIGFLWFAQNTPSKTSPAATTATTPQPTTDTSDLRAGGSSFSDPEGVYVFLYPSDYQLDKQNNGKIIRIYKTGPTQRGQTEMYDGAIVTFETHNLEGQTLTSWVDLHIKTATADGTTKTVEQKKSIAYNNYSGFTYTLRGLGEARYLVLQKDAQSKYGIVITIFIADPQNVGFQKEVDETLATLEILK